MQARIILACAMLAASNAWGQVEIDVRRPIDKRVAVAVPNFATLPGREALGVQMAEVMRYDLDFTGLVRVVTPDQYPASFTAITSDPTKLDFVAWRNSRAEYLVHIYVTQEGANNVAECRLFDTATGQQVVGKRLSAGQDWWRLLVHQFSDEVVRFLDGEPGIATTQICFSGGQTGKKEIYISDYDGAGLTQLTKHNSISILPTFSPNGSKIAYVSFKDRYQFIYVYELSTGRSTALSKEVGMNSAPAWAPDGNRLAIVLSKDANSEIYLVNSDGSGKKRLTNHPAVDSSPAFSPDGGQIAFVSERDGRPQIYVMDTSGGNVRRLSFQGGKSYEPAWSPNGKQIAYVVESGGFQIYVMDADGSNPRQLTSSGSNEAPAWSADSRHIVFSTNQSNSLKAVNVLTGQIRPIPGIGVRAQAPDWGPRR